MVQHKISNMNELTYGFFSFSVVVVVAFDSKEKPNSTAVALKIVKLYHFFL